MVEDFGDDVRLGDEGDDEHPGLAARAFEPVDTEGALEEAGPGAEECLDACRLMSAMLYAAFHGADPTDLLLIGERDEVLSALSAPKIMALARGDWRGKRRSEIRGTGYVVDSLEAAMWCLSSTDCFREAVLLATNLGDDADTTAAVCGQLAGACYGESRIPREWLERLTMAAEIRALADRLASR